jgi:hypothetical protein
VRRNGYFLCLIFFFTTHCSQFQPFTCDAFEADGSDDSTTAIMRLFDKKVKRRNRIFNRENSTENEVRIEVSSHIQQNIASVSKASLYSGAVLRPALGEPNRFE